MIQIQEKNSTVKEIIKKFDLQPHIEGGYFREDFKSAITLPGDLLDKEENRSIVTTCYYLLAQGQKSIFHKITSDEIWYFCSGGPIELFEINEKGNLKKTILGAEISKGQYPKMHVCKNTWFAATPCKETEYALMSCVVFPGFEFVDWEQGDPVYLKKISPDSSDIIDLLT